MATTEMYTYCHTLSLRVALPIVGGPSPVHGRRCPEADEGASAASRSCSPESLRHALAGSIASQACITLRPGIAIRATTPETGNDRQNLRPRLRTQPPADPPGAARTFPPRPPRARKWQRPPPAPRGLLRPPA